jgi:hypothetical protein
MSGDKGVVSPTVARVSLESSLSGGLSETVPLSELRIKPPPDLAGQRVGKHGRVVTFPMREETPLPARPKLSYRIPAMGTQDHRRVPPIPMPDTMVCLIEMQAAHRLAWFGPVRTRHTAADGPASPVVPLPILPATFAFLGRARSSPHFLVLRLVRGRLRILLWPPKPQRLHLPPAPLPDRITEGVEGSMLPSGLGEPRADGLEDGHHTPAG